MGISRRAFVAAWAAASAGLPAQGGAPEPRGRQYHLSVSEDALEADPDLLDTVRAAGVGDIWLTGYLYGYWHYTPERIAAWRRRAERAGLRAHVCNVPLGHPGDSLGAMAAGVPLTPPRHWRPGVRPDASTFAGTSLHPPATEENAAALRRLAGEGVRRVFLDDDFRLAAGPGLIGGCFCSEHRQRFLRTHGYPAVRWNDLLADVAARRLSPLLRAWLALHCDELTDSFRRQAAAAPGIRLGIMVMYLGAEKAGIRLRDFRAVPFRVGELMFSDDSFAPVKGKTDELFSALFHRRFAAPERAFSETTAFPADRLSAANMAAKLVISTIADVRSTMLMSGLSPFPRAHWDTLGPAMRRQAALHAPIAGHRPRGPFKHLWGEHSRMVGDDRPFSLFLAAGVPFEVTDAPARGGWTFLSDADARAAAGGSPRSAGTRFVGRPGTGVAARGGLEVPEELAALWALKREVAASEPNAPVVEEDAPAVCAWYPTARRTLVWNLSEERRSLTVRWRGMSRLLVLDGLAAEIVREEA